MATVQELDSLLSDKPAGDTGGASVSELDKIFATEPMTKVEAAAPPSPILSTATRMAQTLMPALAPKPVAAPIPLPTPMTREQAVATIGTSPTVVQPNVIGEAIRPRTDVEAVEGLIGGAPGPLSTEQAQIVNAPQPLPRDLTGSVVAPNRQLEATSLQTAAKGLIRQPGQAVVQGLKGQVGALIGTALGVGKEGRHETAAEQQYDPGAIDKAIEGAVALGDPITVATFALGAAPGAYAGKLIAQALAKRLGPQVVLQAARAAQATGGAAMSFSVFDAATEALRGAATKEGVDVQRVAQAGKHGLAVGGVMGATGAALVGGPALLRMAGEVGVLASAPAALEGRMPTVEDWIDAGLLVSALKGTHRLSELAKRAVSKPAAERTPVEAQVVRNIPQEVKAELVQDALKTAAEKAKARTPLEEKVAAKGEEEARAEREVEQADLRKTLEPEAPKPEEPPMPGPGMERRGAAAPESDIRPEQEAPGPVVPEGPLRRAVEIQGGRPAPEIQPRPAREAAEREQMAEATKRAGLADYRQVPASFRQFVEAKGRRWPLLPSEPGYLDLRRQYEEIGKPLYLTRGPRLGQWEIVNRVTGEVEATSPNPAMAQLEANRMDARRRQPGPEATQSQPWREMRDRAKMALAVERATPEEPKRDLENEPAVRNALAPRSEAETAEAAMPGRAMSAEQSRQALEQVRRNEDLLKSAGRPQAAPVAATESKQPTLAERGGQPRKTVDKSEPAEFNPDDPDSLGKFIRAKGGLAPSPSGDLKGEYAALPLRFKNRKGLSPDLMAQAVSELAGRPISDAEILNTLAHGGRAKALKAQRARSEESAPDRAAALEAEGEGLKAMPEDQKHRLIAQMTGKSEADVARMFMKPEEPKEAPVDRHDQDVAEFQNAARDFFEGQSEDRVPSLDLLNDPHFERFGGAGRVIHELFDNKPDLALASLENAKADVEGGMVNEERAAYQAGHHDSVRDVAGRLEMAPATGRPNAFFRKTTFPDGTERTVILSAGKPEGHAPTYSVHTLVKYKTGLGPGSTGRQFKFRSPGEMENFARQALEKQDMREIPYDEPAPTRYERTKIGDQALVEGTPRREIPPTKTRPEAPQKPVEETPLFQKPEPGEQPRLPGVQEPRAPYRGREFDGQEYGGGGWIEPSGRARPLREDESHNDAVPEDFPRLLSQSPVEAAVKSGWVRYWHDPLSGDTGIEISASSAEANRNAISYLYDEKPRGIVHIDTVDSRGRVQSLTADAQGQAATRGWRAAVEFLKRRQPGGSVQEEGAPYDASRQAPARFIGYQEGGKAPFPLYNVTRDGKEFTHGAEALKKMGVPVPETPSFEDWSARDAERQDQSTLAESGQTGGVEEPKAPYAPTFFSGLKKLVDDKMPAAAPAPMVRNIIKQGKPDEVKWTGLDDFLAQKAGARVTKQEVKDFLDQNEVRVEEKTLGAPMRSGDLEPIRKLAEQADAENARDAAKLFRRVAFSLEKGGDDIEAAYRSGGLGNALNAARQPGPHTKEFPEGDRGEFLKFEAVDYAKELARHVEVNLGGVPAPTKFERYTLPGGQEYRELLLTLPPPPARDAYSKRFKEVSDKYGGVQGDELARRWTPEENEELRRLAQGADRAQAATYKSPHFDEPNVLAHIRFNDRTDADGKKVLFLEEVQSDWHQEGRRKGYAGQTDTEGWTAEVGSKGVHADIYTVRDSMGLTRGNAIANSPEEAIKKFVAEQDRGRTPAAPFAKTWHELAMKRVLRWAAENGYDKVAWTTGEQQAERYDLSKHVGSITWDKLPDGDYGIRAVGLRGAEIEGLRNRRVAPDKLADLIGKELADKILTSDQTSGKFEGLDLKVGGEGMKGFYDRILPEFLNKYGKKWGARVGETYLRPEGETKLLANDDAQKGAAIGAVPVHSLDITPAMKDSVLHEGQALFEPRQQYSLQYDLRPGVAPAVRKQGEQLLLDLARPREVETVASKLPTLAKPQRGVEGGSGVRTLGLAIRDDLIKHGRVELRGQEVKTADDVATLAQIFRNPDWETFRMMYVDDAGKILATEGISNRLSGSAIPFLTGDQPRDFYDFRDRMKRLGASGYWMLHNHPSTNPSPSKGDIGLTKRFADNVPGFKGHVIIDSKNYGLIDAEHTQSVNRIETDETLYQPRVPHRLLGRTVFSPMEMVKIGKEIESPEGWITLLHRDASGRVRAIQEMPEAEFMQPEGEKYIKGRQRAWGAMDTVAYSPKWSEDGWLRAHRLVKFNTLVDAVTETGRSLKAGMSDFDTQTARYTRQLLDNRHPIRVEEEGAPYGLDPDLLARITKYGRAHAKGDYEAWSKQMVQDLGPKAEPYLKKAWDEISQKATTATAPPPKPPAQAKPAAAPSSGDPLKDIDEMAREPEKAPFKERLSNLKERIIETQVNRFEPLRRLSRALEARGATVDPGKEPIEVAEITKGRGMGQSEIFKLDLEGIVGDAQKIGMTEDLNRYLTLAQFAKRIRDLSARPDSEVTPDGRTKDGGYVNPRQFDRAKVEAGMAELEKKAGERWPELQALAKRVWDMNRTLLTRAKNAGLVSQAAYDEIVSRGDDYVPIQVLDYLDEVGKAAVASTKPLDVRYQDVLKRMEGTERDVRNVLASSYDKGLRIIGTVNRNLAARAVGDLAPKLKGLVDEVPGDTFTLPEDREVVSAFYDGHRKNFAVAPEIKRAMDFLDDEQIGLIGRVLGAAKTPLQIGATGANLAFAIPNVIRDTKRAAMYSKYGVQSPADAVRFGADWIQGLLHSIKKDDLWKQAAESGALFSTMQKSITPETFLKAATGSQSLVSRLNLAKRSVETAQKINNALEEATKLATFQRGLRSGDPIEKIAYEVANYGGSPNFGRAGSYGQHLNLLWMFYNARLQGTAGNLRRLREAPEVAAKAALWRIGSMVVVPTLALWAYNQQWDGDHGMEDIPDGDKQRYHIILLPETYRSSTGETRRKYVKIPKEETEQILDPMLRGLMNWMKGAHPDSAAQIVGDVVGAMSPIGFDVRGEPTVDRFLKAGASGLLASANPAVRVPIEVGTNYNAFQQGPLVPKSLEEHVRPTEQARPTTSRTIQEISAMLDKVPGAEAMGVTSPIKLQHIVTSSTGGAGQSGIDATDFVLALARKHLMGQEGRPAVPETVPTWERVGRQVLASRFMGTGGGQEDRAAELRFYDALDEVRRARGSIKLTEKREGKGTGQPIRDETPNLQDAKRLETLSRQLGKAYRDQIQITYYSDKPLEEREEALVRLAARRHSILDEFRKLEETRKTRP